MIISTIYYKNWLIKLLLSMRHNNDTITQFQNNISKLTLFYEKLEDLKLNMSSSKRDCLKLTEKNKNLFNNMKYLLNKNENIIASIIKKNKIFEYNREYINSVIKNYNLKGINYSSIKYNDIIKEYSYKMENIVNIDNYITKNLDNIEIILTKLYSDISSDTIDIPKINTNLNSHLNKLYITKSDIELAAITLKNLEHDIKANTEKVNTNNLFIKNQFYQQKITSLNNKLIKYNSELTASISEINNLNIKIIILNKILN